MSDFLKLNTKSLLDANFDVLDKDFTFVVDGQQYPTSKFVASLLSPEISKAFSTDKSLSSYTINTNSRGNFDVILNAVSVREQVVSNEDKEFLCEILDKFKNKNLRIELNICPSEITYENVFSDLLTQVQYPHYYQEIIDKKVPIFAEKMYQILSKENERQQLLKLDLEIIERIVTHEKLVIETEDQLLEFINSLYSKKRESRHLYQYVNFAHCSSTSMRTFLNHFSVDDIDEFIWSQMKRRLEQFISNPISLSEAKRLHFREFPKGHKEDFDGIFEQLQKETNNQIENEIDITCSSPIYNNNITAYGPYNSIKFDTTGNYFITDNHPNIYVCYEFKNHHIIPTHYKIRSRPCGNDAPINFKIEISIDGFHWEEIDRQNNAPFQNGVPGICEFSINESKHKECKFIRLTQTGKNSLNRDYLTFKSIEFYGYLK